MPNSSFEDDGGMGEAEYEIIRSDRAKVQTGITTLHDFINNQHRLDPVSEKILYDNCWDLYESTAINKPGDRPEMDTALLGNARQCGKSKLRFQMFPTLLLHTTVQQLEKPVLIFTVGLPKSGKSIWAKKSGIPVLNVDKVGLVLNVREDWNIVKATVRSLHYFLKSGTKVIIIESDTNQPHRDQLIKCLRLRGVEFDVQYRCFHTDASVCIQNAIESNREDLVELIKKMVPTIVYPEQTESELIKCIDFVVND